ESLENGVDDAVHAFDIHEAHHGASAAANFDEAALDHIGGAQFAPTGGGEKRRTIATPVSPAATAGPWRGRVDASASGRHERQLRPELGCRRDRWPGLRLSPRRSPASALFPECCASCGPSSADAAPADRG